MTEPVHRLGPVLRAIDEQLRLALALRRGYLRRYPDAPRSPRERELEALARRVGLDPFRAVYGGEEAEGGRR